MFKILPYIVFFFFISSCTSSSLTPLSNANVKNYTGQATLLVAVDGDERRKLRHIEIATNEEPEGYEIYFHDNKLGKGLLPITLPTPSTNVRIKEYSLSGHYGCSRGKAGYGYGHKRIAKITNGNAYFLGTINTSMNTTYNEMPNRLINEAKNKYHYILQAEDFENKGRYKSHISL